MFHNTATNSTQIAFNCLSYSSSYKGSLANDSEFISLRVDINETDLSWTLKFELIIFDLGDIAAFVV